MNPAWPERLFVDPARRPIDAAVLRHREGAAQDLDVARWHAAPAPEELRALARTVGPVLDVGCGPGRHAAAVTAAGGEALGIDVSAEAVATARRRGAAAVQASVFGPVPHTGRWGSALLLDGNLGIGGDAVALLARVRELLGPDGLVLAELDADTGARPGLVRVERCSDVGPWFRWDRVGPARIWAVAAAAGLRTEEVWTDHGRWFALLRVNPALGVDADVAG